MIFNRKHIATLKQTSTYSKRFRNSALISIALTLICILIFNMQQSGPDTNDPHVLEALGKTAESNAFKQLNNSNRLTFFLTLISTVLLTFISSRYFF